MRTRGGAKYFEALTDSPLKKLKLTKPKQELDLAAPKSTVRTRKVAKYFEKTDEVPLKQVKLEKLSLEQSKGDFEKADRNDQKQKSQPKKPKLISADKFPSIKPIWKTHFDNIVKMQSGIVAPVDNMGCDKLMNAKDSARDQRFQILMSLLFSSQTKDPVNAACLERFHSNKWANLESCLSQSEDALAKIITPVSFYRTKAKNLKKIAQILKTEFDSDIPKTLDGLVSLPGIGFKMAHLIMNAAWGLQTGIAVDVHVHRTVNRLKWFPKIIEKPNDMMVALEKHVPKEYWVDFRVDIEYLLLTPFRSSCSAITVRAVQDPNPG